MGSKPHIAVNKEGYGASAKAEISIYQGRGIFVGRPTQRMIEFALALIEQLGYGSVTRLFLYPVLKHVSSCDDNIVGGDYVEGDS